MLTRVKVARTLGRSTAAGWDVRIWERQVGVGLLLATSVGGCTTADSPRPVPISPSRAPATAAASTPAGPVDWIVAELDAPTHVSFWDVVDGGERLVAVGQRVVESTYRYPAAWTSEDGTTWTEASLPSEGGGQVTSLAWSPALGYVAAGSDDNGSHLWHSVDGVAWSVASAEDALDPWADGGPVVEGEFCCGVDVRDVAAGPVGFIAVGIAGDMKTSPRAAVLTSPDGVSWNRVPFSEDLEGGSMGGLVHVPSIGWMASGSHAWTSRDGTTWSRGDRLGRAPLVLGEHDGRPLAASVWGGSIHTTQDGLEWTRRETDLEQREDVEVRHLVSSADGVIALGHRGIRERRALVLWLSPDGASWTRELVLEDANVQTSPIVLDGVVVLYGWTDELEPRSWSVPLADFARAGPVTPPD